MNKSVMEDLKPANENPWYVLMTLYGEQGERNDLGLAKKNAEIWNIWACQGLSDQEFQQLNAANVDIPDRNLWFQRQKEVARKHEVEMLRRNATASDGRTFSYPGLPSVKDELDFSWCEISPTLNCRRYIFSMDVDFHRSSFFRNASFAHAVFLQFAHFSEASFRRGSNFNHVHFLKGLDFENVEFEKTASFFGSSFHDGVSFEKCVLRRGCSFTRSRFDGDVFFSDVSIEGNSSFNHASFKNGIHFDRSIFSSDANFERITFSKDATFTSVRFFTNAVFDGSTFSGMTRFNEIKVGSEHGQNSSRMRLDDVTFERPTSFKNAIFKDCILSLTGTSFHPQTLLTADTDFWPKAKQPYAKQTKETFATLRNLVAKQGLPEEEYFFFRKELEAAGQFGPLLQRLPYIFYGIVSDYGHSILRPAVGLFFLWLVGFVLFQGCGAGQAFCLTRPPNPRVLAWDDAMGLSFSNMFGFFGFQRLYFVDVLEHFPSWLKFAASVQTISSFILLFFFGLGLRQRFRLR